MVVQLEEWVGRVEEFRVEDDLDAVGAVVEQLAAAEGAHHRVGGVFLNKTHAYYSRGNKKSMGNHLMISGSALGFYSGGSPTMEIWEKQLEPGDPDQQTSHILLSFYGSELSSSNGGNEVPQYFFLTSFFFRTWMLCVVMGGRAEDPCAKTQRLSLTMSFFASSSAESGMTPRRQISYIRFPMSFWISSMVSFSPLVTAWPRRDSTLKLFVLVGKMRKATLAI